MDKAVKIGKPCADDRLPWNIQFAVWALPPFFVAHQLKLFSLLAEKPRSLDEICEAKDLKRRQLRSNTLVGGFGSLTRTSDRRTCSEP
jgi:hypothetical protein